MTPLIVIDDNKLFTKSLDLTLSNSEIKVIQLPLSSSENMVTQIADTVRESAAHRVLLINANLVFNERDKRGDNRGIDLERTLLSHEEIRNQLSIIMTSFLARSSLEQQGGIDFPKTASLSFLTMPFTLDRLTDLVNASMEERVTEKEVSEAAKRFNLTKAIESIRSTKHDIQNAILAVVSLLRNVIAHAESEEMINNLIAIVRRDEGKEKTWVDWFAQELNCFPEELGKLGFVCGEEFPEQFARLQEARKRVDSYLRHFHLGDAAAKMTGADKKAIRDDASATYDALRSLRELFEDMADSLKRKYSS